MVEAEEGKVASEENLKIKKRIRPSHDARAIRVSRFVFIFPWEPHRAALKEQVF
jgi:hypothetical protein